MYFSLFLLIFVFLGCSPKQIHPEAQQAKIETLSMMLMRLDPKVNPKEARHLAHQATHYAQKLAQNYEVRFTPWIHNTLVNVGLKERGLCHQWTEDLLIFLQKQHYTTFQFHAMGANVGKLNEHNALVVTAKGQVFTRGIVLDAWRRSGDLYFIELLKDTDYDWVERKGLYGVLK